MVRYSLMVGPTAVAPILGLKQIPSGNRVTFAARVLRCRRQKGKSICLLADESDLIEVEGPGVEKFKPGESLRIEHGVTRRHPPHLACIHLDKESKVVPLKEPVWTPLPLKGGKG